MPIYQLPHKPRQTNVTLAVIGEGAHGTRATLQVMARIIQASKLNLMFRVLACDIIADVAEKDAWGEVSAVQRWVRDNIRYTSDIENVETVQDPETLLYTRNGDCDDKTILVSTLLQSIGYPVRLVAVAFSGVDYSHVLAQVLIAGKWIAVETTEPVELGWFPEGVTAQLTVAV